MLELAVTAALAMGIQFHGNTMNLNKAEVSKIETWTGVNILVTHSTPTFQILILPGESVKIVGFEDDGANRSPKNDRK